jgi:predicted peptidase
MMSLLGPLLGPLLTSALLAVPPQFRTHAAGTGFLDRAVVVDGDEYRYQVYVPRGYTAAERWPVLLALHGSGERGDDGLLQTQVGLGGAIRRHAQRFPGIVVFPQAPVDAPGWHGIAGRIALAALDAAEAEFSTDRSRVYLTGLSMGGNGSWYLAYNDPQRFAALVVVCGFTRDWRSPEQATYPPIVGGAEAEADAAASPYAAIARRIAHIPTWIFHGDADPVVPVDESRQMAAALTAAGGDVRYTELAGVGHNAWDPAYTMDELPRWLFVQRRR